MEPLLHLTIPFVLLLLVGIEAKKALPISVLALIPDMDALFYVHRSLSHSIIILSAAVGLLLLIPNRKTGSRILLALALLAVASHPILDLFTGYTPILWPLYNYSLWLQLELIAHIGSSPSISLSGQMLMEPISFQPFQSLDAPLFTGRGLIISMMLVTSILFRAIQKKRDYQLQPTACAQD